MNNINTSNLYRISLDTDRQVFIATDTNNDFKTGTGVTIKDAIKSLKKVSA